MDWARLASHQLVVVVLEGCQTWRCYRLKARDRWRGVVVVVLMQTDDTMRCTSLGPGAYRTRFDRGPTFTPQRTFDSPRFNPTTRSLCKNKLHLQGQDPARNHMEPWAKHAATTLWLTYRGVSYLQPTFTNPGSPGEVPSRFHHRVR